MLISRQPAEAAPNLATSSETSPRRACRRSASGCAANGSKACAAASSHCWPDGLAPDQSAADQLADALLGTSLADGVIGLSQGRWLERQRGDNPWWRGICRDAIRLQPTLNP